MPRASSGKKAEAEKLFNKGLKLIDIAKKLDIPEGTIRSWKNRGKWGTGDPKKNRCNVAKCGGESNATLQKKKRGAPPGNQNAKGSKGGGAPLRNKNAEKHWAFTKLYFADINDDEWELINCMDDTEERQLLIQLQLFSIRERRLMNSLMKYREMETKNHGLSVDNVSKTKKSEDVTNMDGESIGAGFYKKVTETTVTHTKAVMSSIITLEAELTKIQKAKTKAIEALVRLRMEEKKLESETDGNDTADDWIAAVLGVENDG